jgi:hypothetical protein
LGERIRVSTRGRGELKLCVIETCELPAPYPKGVQSREGVDMSLHCMKHLKSFVFYGTAEPPIELTGRPQCSFERMASGSRDQEQEGGGEAGPTGRCAEPSVGNGLCLIHVVGECEGPPGYRPSLREARSALQLWIGRQDYSSQSYRSNEALRVLAEIDGIRNWGSKNPSIPRNPEKALFGLFFAMTGFWGTPAGPPYERILDVAFSMSPFCLGEALNIDADRCRTHLNHLLDSGLVASDPLWSLPRDLRVVRAVYITRRLAWFWRWERFRQRLPSRSTIVELPRNLPKAKQTVLLPSVSGPGIVEAKYQGEVLMLTEKGQIQLADWLDKANAGIAKDALEKLKLRLQIATTVLATAGVVSIIANLGKAAHAVVTAWHWLF